MLSLEQQQAYLQQVSRTFALTIPLIKGKTADIVANAYLLCRIADTAEDDPRAPLSVKTAWLRRFASFMQAGFADDRELASLRDEAAVFLKDGAVPCEYKLSCDLPEVIARTRTYPDNIRQIIGRGVAILSEGMAAELEGVTISTLADVDRYCYFVAGVVGEMLACLFQAIRPCAQPQLLLQLGVSFGEGLQLVNILKDRSEDSKRAVSFLPPVPGTNSAADAFILHYCALAQGHLLDGADFVCALPRSLYGVRVFCMVNLAMAVLTLRNIAHNPQGTQQALKITRAEVKSAVLWSSVCACSNTLSRWYLKKLGRGLEVQRRNPAALRQAVSVWDNSNRFLHS